MPTATLRFKLPENQDEFEVAYGGQRWKNVVTELAEWLRKDEKYGESKHSEVRGVLLGLLADENLEL